MENRRLGCAADAVAARQRRCWPRPSADAHKYTISYVLCSIRMARVKDAPPPSARNSQAHLAAGSVPTVQNIAAADVQVCHARSAAAPTTKCTM